jgi:hypothetical protein
MRANGSQRLVVIRSRTSTRPSPYQSSGRCYQDRQKLAPPVRALPSPPLSQAQSLTRVKASRCPHRYRQPHSCRSPRGRLVAASLSRQQQAAHRSARTTRGRRCCANQKGVVLSQCALRLSRACLGQIIVLSSKQLEQRKLRAVFSHLLPIQPLAAAPPSGTRWIAPQSKCSVDENRPSTW